MSCLQSVSPRKTGVHSPIFHVLGQALCSIQLLKRPVAVYIDWCNERNIAKPLVETWQDFMSKLEQNKGEEYSRWALLGFCNSVERHSKQHGMALHGKCQKLKSQNSNKILDAKLRINRCADKENFEQKLVIEATDLVQLRANLFLSMTTSAGLLRRTWFYRFPFTGADVGERATETFAATVSSLRTIPMAASKRSWPMKKPQTTIPMVKTASPRLNEKQGFIALEQMMMVSLPVWSCL